MKFDRAMPWLFAALLLTGLAGTASAAAPSEATSSGRYIVLLHDDPAGGTQGRDAAARGAGVEARVAGVSRRHGVRPTLTFRSAVKGFAARLTAAQVRSLRADPAIAAVEPDRPTRVDGTVENGDGSPAAGVRVIYLSSAVVPTGVRRVRADRSPVARIDGSDQRVNADVAIIDTGIDRAHPDLNVAGGYNCTTSDRADYHDGYGHGTHVAGTVAALDNGRGVVGVAPGARLWALKVFDDQGDGWASWWICGVDWVASRRDPADSSRPLVEVANMSLRGPLSPHSDANCGYATGDALHQSICRAISAGTVFVVAAGNDTTNARYWRPAAYDEPITVSAMADFDGKPGGVGLQSETCPWYSADGDDTFANFSNYGGDVDLMAPGKCILSTYPAGRYAWMSGTSMAAPTVAGGAALYRASYPSARPQQVKQALRYVATYGWKTSTDPDGVPDRLLDVDAFAPPPYFTFAATGSTRYLGIGQTIGIPLQVGRVYGHTSPVSLIVGRLPAGVSTPTKRAPITGTSGSLALRGGSGLVSGRYAVTVTASDGELRRTATVSFVVDATPPRGDFASPAEGTTRLQAQSGVTVAWSEAEAGSGLLTRALQRQRGRIVTAGSCAGVRYLDDGASSRSSSPVAATGLSGGYCYRWVLRLTDRARNTTTRTSGAVLVDTTAPPPPNVSASGAGTWQAAPNGLIWYRGSVAGTVVLSASGTDRESGIAGAMFGALTRGTRWGYTPGAVAGDPARRSLTWSAGAPATALLVSTTNRIGRTGASRAVSLRPDVTAPAPVRWTVPAAFLQQNSSRRVLAWTGGSDTGSGLAARQHLQRQSGRIVTRGTCAGVTFANEGAQRAMANGALDVGLLSGRCYRWLVTTVDRVGNRSSPVASAPVLVDGVAPRVDFSMPNETTTRLQRATSASVIWTASDSGGSTLRAPTLLRQRGRIAAPGTCAQVRYVNDGIPQRLAPPVTSTGLVTGYCYRWIARVTDAAGNVGSSVSGAILVDTTAPPAPTITARGTGAHQRVPNGPIYFKGDAAGSVTVAVFGRDSGSGAIRSTIGPLVVNTRWTVVASTTGNPATRTLSWRAGAPDTSLRATTTDRVGLTSTTRRVAFVRDVTRPTLQFLGPSASFTWSGPTYVVRWTERDAASGIDPATRSLRRQKAKPVTAGSCAGVTWAADGHVQAGSPVVVTGLARNTCYRWVIVVRDRVGNGASLASKPVLVDGVAPTVRAPQQTAASPVQLDAAGMLTVRVSWSGSDNTGSPVSYRLRRTSDGRNWVSVPLPRASATAAFVRLPATGSHRFSVRAVDRYGNWSGWRWGPAFAVRLADSTSSAVSYSGTWTLHSHSAALGGSTRYATTTGARASFSFSGQSVAWVASYGPGRGRAQVWIDGAYVGTIDLYRPRTSYRRTVFAFSWATSGRHTITVRVVRVAAHPRVDVDGFVVVRPPS